MYVVRFEIQTDAKMDIRDVQHLWKSLREETEGFPGVKVAYEAFRIQHLGRGDSDMTIEVSH